MSMAIWIVSIAVALILPLAGYWLYQRTRSPVARPSDRFRMPMDADGTPPTLTEEMRRVNAANDAVKAADLAPADGALQGLAGRKLIHANRFETAVPYLRRAVDLDPSADHLADLGFALLGTDRVDEASYFIKQARALDENHADAWYYWALALAEIECHAESNRELEAMIEAHPHHAPARAELAFRWEQRGNDQQALLGIESVLESEPDYIPARIGLVRLLCKRGQFLDAKPQLSWLSAHGVPVQVSTRGGELHVAINGTRIFDGDLSGS